MPIRSPLKGQSGAFASIERSKGKKPALLFCASEGCRGVDLVGVRCANNKMPGNNHGRAVVIERSPNCTSPQKAPCLCHPRKGPCRSHTHSTTPSLATTPRGHFAALNRAADAPAAVKRQKWAARPSAGPDYITPGPLPPPSIYLPKALKQPDAVDPARRCPSVHCASGLQEVSKPFKNRVNPSRDYSNRQQPLSLHAGAYRIVHRGGPGHATNCDAPHLQGRERGGRDKRAQRPPLPAPMPQIPSPAQQFRVHHKCPVARLHRRGLTATPNRNAEITAVRS